MFDRSNRPHKLVYEGKRHKYFIEIVDKRHKYFHKTLVPPHYCVILNKRDDQIDYYHC